MDFQQLIQKAEIEGLTADEQAQVVSFIDADLKQLKEEHPEQYLQTLKAINTVLIELDKDLKSI